MSEASDGATPERTLTGGGRPTRSAGRRVRGGLGRGLGALIPDAEEDGKAAPSRPLDVLFPDLVGGHEDVGSSDGKTRGGSARDLLGPGQSAGRGKGRGKAAMASRALSGDGAKAQGDDTNAIVSRETIATAADVEAGEATKASSKGSSDGAIRPGHTGRTEKLEGTDRAGFDRRSEAIGEPVTGIVSRETIGDAGTSAATAASGHIVSPPMRPTGEGGDTAVAEALPDDGAIVSRETISASVEPAATGETGADNGGLDAGQTLTRVPGTSFGMVSPEWIIPNLKQPRQVFDEGDLEELTDSIREVGVLQPVVVRRITEDTLSEPGQRERLAEALRESPEARYELIMGERRWRAAQQAALSEIPVIVRSTDEDDLLREALIENMHRVQLNPLEEAAAYNQLMEDFNYTQEELSKRIARSRPQIANTLRLLRLPPSVQRQVAAGVLSAGHARALLSMTSTSEMEALAARVVAEGLSVRATEEMAKYGKRQSHRRARSMPNIAPEAQRVADAVAGMLDTSVSVSPGIKKGRLVIHYADQDDLERIAAALGL